MNGKQDPIEWRLSIYSHRPGPVYPNFEMVFLLI